MDESESSRCAGCMNTLLEQDYVSALGQEWHTDCFRCCACDAALSSWYLEKDGLLFCEADYWARYGECCRQCSQVMTGPVMVAGEHRFHPECFTCAACRAFIEDGEPYALLERSKLYCGGCYKSFMQPLSRGRSAHSIRIVEMPPISGSDRSPQIRLAASDKRGPITADYACRGVTIQEMDASCGLVTLHIGDRILEINGTPIQDQPVSEIERVLCCSDTVLQLTIEHDPDNVSFKPHQRCRLSIDEPKATKHASDTKSKIERKQMKLDETNKPNIPTEQPTDETHSKLERMEVDVNANHRQPPLADDTSDVSAISIEERSEEGGRARERLFKRRGDGPGGKVRLRRRQAAEAPLEKERSSSMSRLLDAVAGDSVDGGGVLCDLSRARSFRVDSVSNQRVFRAADLLQGELLGCGFFGQVYKVTHRDTGEVMVLKQLYRVDEEAQRNFLKEVAVLRSLAHANVLRFVGVLYKDKRLHLVTEYVAGGTLQQLLQESDAALCWAVRARLARDIAAGVGYLHRMNVIHRDLNSHNCLVREDKTVIVADFGLARIVQRAAGGGAPGRRKRYTVVGNPYWMAPEMMKGNRYDEKVDVFSFGIILCEIIGRVQADPDYLPRRSDFGLNEALFRDKFCQGCPEPFCRLAFLCCDLNPDSRPPFEVLEVWLESLVMHLSVPGALPPALLADIAAYRAGGAAHLPPAGAAAPHACCAHGGGACGGHCCLRAPRRSACGKVGLESEAARDGGDDGRSESNSKVPTPEPPLVIRAEDSPPERGGRALGKCVSAGQICQARRPAAAAKLSRSQNTLAAPAGYILRAHGASINITRVDDISQWLDPPPPLKRSSPDLADPTTKTRRIDQTCRDADTNLPCFLRNQSVEGLESESKSDLDYPQTFCRHHSIPDTCETSVDSDLSDDDESMCSWYRRVDSDTPLRDKKPEVGAPKLVVDMVNNGRKFLNADSPERVILRHPPKPGTNERKIEERDCKRYNIDHLTATPGVSEGVKHLQQKFSRAPSNDKPQEKTSFFSKKLLSPKLGRLFRQNTTEVDGKKLEEVKSPRMLSKFFVQRPASPGPLCKSSYRVRPVDASLESKGKFKTDTREIERSVLDSDVKLASMGKPMTPIFRRHVHPEIQRFQDGRFSCRDHRSSRTEGGQEPRYAELRRSRVISPGSVLRVDASKLSPLSRCTNTSDIPALGVGGKQHAKKTTDGKEKESMKREGISRGNYVSLANLKINCKPKELEKGKVVPKSKTSPGAVNIPVERVI